MERLMPDKSVDRFSPAFDRHRRVALGITEGQLASEAGLTVEELRAYEGRPPDSYDTALHLRVSEVLDRFERRQKGQASYGLI